MVLNESLNVSLQCAGASGEALLLFVGGLVCLLVLCLFIFVFYGLKGAMRGRSGYVYWLSLFFAVIVIFGFVMLWLARFSVLGWFV